MMRDSVCFTTLKSLDYNVVMTFSFNNNDDDASAHVRQSSASGRQLSATPTPSEIGRKRTSEYLRDVFEAPPKSRRLEIASQIKALEIQHNRTVNRIKKTKHQHRRKLRHKSGGAHGER